MTTDTAALERRQAYIDEQLKDVPTLLAWADEQCSHCDMSAPWDAKFAALLALSCSVPVSGEGGWLIEHPTEPRWWTGWPGSVNDGLFWTTDASQSIRFAREVDARKFSSQHFDDGDYRITDHAWTMGPPPVSGEGQAARDVLAERRRQVEVEGWTAEHDDECHSSGELARAAAAYAMPWNWTTYDRQARGVNVALAVWPWDCRGLKRNGDRRLELVKAAALILAEIERLDRRAPAEAYAATLRPAKESD